MIGELEFGVGRVWKHGVTGLFKGSGKLVKSRSVGSCYDDGGGTTGTGTGLVT
jgi:hypothetical protein